MSLYSFKKRLLADHLFSFIKKSLTKILLQQQLLEEYFPLYRFTNFSALQTSLKFPFVPPPTEKKPCQINK